MLGAALGRHCPWGSQAARWLFLSGELGSGKTTMAAAVLAAAGVRETVRSPTYALVETYPLGERLAVHVDLYRLGGAQEVEQLGLRDYLQANTLLLLEWPERIEGTLPRPDLLVQLQISTQGRLCNIEALSAFGEAWLALVEQEMPRPAAP
jgi:tRNA threonylcarbamoyladenosine biosynthesis protein TsaE